MHKKSRKEKNIPVKGAWVYLVLPVSLIGATCADGGQRKSILHWSSRPTYTVLILCFLGLLQRRVRQPKIQLILDKKCKRRKLCKHLIKQWEWFSASNCLAHEWTLQGRKWNEDVGFLVVLSNTCSPSLLSYRLRSTQVSTFWSLSLFKVCEVTLMVQTKGKCNWGRIAYCWCKYFSIPKRIRIYNILFLPWIQVKRSCNWCSWWLLQSLEHIHFLDM